MREHQVGTHTPCLRKNESVVAKKKYEGEVFKAISLTAPTAVLTPNHNTSTEHNDQPLLMSLGWLIRQLCWFWLGLAG